MRESTSVSKLQRPGPSLMLLALLAPKLRSLGYPLLTLGTLLLACTIFPASAFATPLYLVTSGVVDAGIGCFGGDVFGGISGFGNGSGFHIEGFSSCSFATSQMRTGMAHVRVGTVFLEATIDGMSFHSPASNFTITALLELDLRFAPIPACSPCGPSQRITIEPFEMTGVLNLFDPTTHVQTAVFYLAGTGTLRDIQDSPTSGSEEAIFTFVPEPSSFGLLAVGMLALAVLGRRVRPELLR